MTTNGFGIYHTKENIRTTKLQMLPDTTAFSLLCTIVYYNIFTKAIDLQVFFFFIILLTACVHSLVRKTSNYCFKHTDESLCPFRRYRADRKADRNKVKLTRDRIRSIIPLFLYIFISSGVKYNSFAASLIDGRFCPCAATHQRVESWAAKCVLNDERREAKRNAGPSWVPSINYITQLQRFLTKAYHWTDYVA